MQTLIPAGRQIMALKMSHPQPEALLELIKQGVQRADFIRDLIDHVDIVGRAGKTAWQNERSGPADEQARRTIQMRAKLTQILPNGLGLRFLHDPILQRGKAGVAEIFLPDRLELFPDPAGGKPGAESLVSPMLLQGVETIANEEARAEIQRRVAGLFLNRVRKLQRVDLWPAPHQAPKVLGK